MEQQDSKLSFAIEGQIVDLEKNRIFPGRVEVSDGKISRIQELPSAAGGFILPGFIDSHVHIESSMLVPSEFARMALLHGTVGSVSDPHEIANVLGIDGVRFMIDNGNRVPFKFCFGAPSCVPATCFESAGSALGEEDTEKLLEMPDIRYLSEMMNVPGVLFGDKAVHAKLELAKKYGKPIDGHAPSLRGKDAATYIASGISTDHECVEYEEGLEKINQGMMISIREGSAAKNFEALVDLIKDHSDMVMFCSDDKHPDELLKGHINKLVARAVAKGIDVHKVLKAACVNPVKHYRMDVGLLRAGDSADFIVVDSLKEFNVLETYVNGVKVAASGKSLVEPVKVLPVNRFECSEISKEALKVSPAGSEMRVIEVIEGQLITNELIVSPLVENGEVINDPKNDVLKLVVLNRYSNQKPAIGFVKNMGLKRGAIASSVAHDSHNIVACGCNDDDLVNAINLVVRSKGGISAVCGKDETVLPLPVAGLMSSAYGKEVAAMYERLDRKAKEFGSKLAAPYMTLSFLALLVIPKLKLSDKGLFNGVSFKFTSLFLDSMG